MIQPNFCTIERLSAIYRRSIVENVWIISTTKNWFCQITFVLLLLISLKFRASIKRHQKWEELNGKIELNWDNSLSFFYWFPPRQFDFHWKRNLCNSTIKFNRCLQVYEQQRLNFSNWKSKIWLNLKVNRFLLLLVLKAPIVPNS